jgi:NADPH2:quinone reductase
MVHLLGRRDLLGPMVTELFEAVAAGELEVVIGGVYPLGEARRAHEEIAARRTQGKLVIDPAG